jgi:hypothetical protein
MRSLSPANPNRLVAALAAVLAGAALTACGAVSTGSPGSGSPTPASSPTSGTTIATDSDNGKTVELRVGDRLEVQLSSTYWNVTGSSNPSVLRAMGPAVVSPQPSGCVPGAGCGLVTELFAAVSPGTAVVTASRNSCGEAMGCTGNQGSYRVTVTVTG